jgi:4-amino-4-deoxy-L-arabinose transferase-like glycosyltransferase
MVVLSIIAIGVFLLGLVQGCRAALAGNLSLALSWVFATASGIVLGAMMNYKLMGGIVVFAAVLLILNRVGGTNEYHERTQSYGPGVDNKGMEV